MSHFQIFGYFSEKDCTSRPYHRATGQKAVQLHTRVLFYTKLSIGQYCTKKQHWNSYWVMTALTQVGHGKISSHFVLVFARLWFLKTFMVGIKMKRVLLNNNL
jgi:hypothetical protein